MGTLARNGLMSHILFLNRVASIVNVGNKICCRFNAFIWQFSFIL